MKKAFSIIKTVLVWLVVALAVFMMIFTVISVNTFNRNDRDIFGYRAYVVLSDSMSATDFDAGDLILAKKVDPTMLKPGDIISYISQDTNSYGKTITHKIRSLTTDADGNPGFITYGTTTNTDDPVVVTYPFILGKYEFHLPKVGTFFQFLKTTPGYIVCILIPFLLLIIYQGVNCVRVFRRYKAEQMAELQAEKDALEAERRKSEEMMAQLMAMQEQMNANAAPAASPAPKEEASSDSAPQPNVAAMMAQIEALKAQLADVQQSDEAALDDIIEEFGSENADM